MRSILLLSLTVAASFGFCDNVLRAQGRGRGATGSLGALSRGNAHGTSSAMQSLSRSGIGRAGTGIGHATGGLQRAGSSLTRVPTLRAPTTVADRSWTNQQRILDRRLHQADHLRSLSEQNGNARLHDTANHMEHNAEENNSRQTSRFQADAPAVQTNDGRHATGRTETARRGLWIQSR